MPGLSPESPLRVPLPGTPGRVLPPRTGPLWSLRSPWRNHTSHLRGQWGAWSPGPLLVRAEHQSRLEAPRLPWLIRQVGGLSRHQTSAVGRVNYNTQLLIEEALFQKEQALFNEKGSWLIHLNLINPIWTFLKKEKHRHAVHTGGISGLRVCVLWGYSCGKSEQGKNSPASLNSRALGEKKSKSEIKTWKNTSLGKVMF